MFRLFALTILILVPVTYISGQNSRSHLKAAQQLIDNGYFEEAVQQYNNAIALDPQYGQAYEDRAKAFEHIGKLTEAASDYEKAAVFGTNSSENYLKSAKIYLSLKNTPSALESLDRAISEKQNFHEAYILQSGIYFNLDYFEKALESAENAITSGNSAYAFYLKGKAEFALKDYFSAEHDIEKAINKDKQLTEAFLLLAKIQLETGKIQSAITNCSYLIQNDRNNSEAYIIRSQAYRNLNELTNSIADISVSISLDTNNLQNYILRGEYYLDFAQYQNAINDFNIVLNSDMVNIPAIKNRALALEKLGNNKDAASDYSLLLKINNDLDDKIRGELSEKIYFLKREFKKPIINISRPTITKFLEVPVPTDKNEIELTGNIEDDSKIKILKINNDTIIDNLQGIELSTFNIKIATKDLDFINISATDVYNNASTVNYPVIQIETHPPGITLINPFVVEDDLINIETDDNFLYLEGKIEDESLIASIQIDETNASFAPGSLNPRFTATLDISNKNKLKITVTDIYQNKTEKEFLFQKNGRILNTNSPMGKTWVVLIGNSEYKNFSNLKAPLSDIEQIEKALDRYKISNFIIKKNLTKYEMERFFSLDLRDLIRTNHVNSLLIWFAGHGENINGNGYWIPSDAKEGNELTYYNINALKASLYSYNSLTHLLVVSDACSTGPGFNIAMRGTMGEFSCSQTDLLNKKSFQVFTSAGTEKAYDNSLFARSFSNALLNNDDDCMTIDELAKRIIIILQANSSQVPEFGRIAGLNDEQGTFFFISR
jgi:tetratricopeptide (TPR) repeat protein